MKTSDYVSVGFVAVIVTVVAYFLLNSILGNPSKATVKFNYIGNASSDLASPDSEVFNAAAVNPTVEVYVGSCIDEDQDGILSEKERRDCGEMAPETNTGVTESNYLEANKGLSNEENEAINEAGNYAKGTTAEQREAVEESITEYKEQQAKQNEETENAASRETVSGS